MLFFQNDNENKNYYLFQSVRSLFIFIVQFRTYFSKWLIAIKKPYYFNINK